MDNKETTTQILKDIYIDYLNNHYIPSTGLVFLAKDMAELLERANELIYDSQFLENHQKFGPDFIIEWLKDFESFQRGDK